MTSDSYWRSVHRLASAEHPALHMPGHGNRVNGLQAFGALTGDVLALDQSEIGGLDYLHEPVGPLLRAQQVAAELFGAERSWFLVNGATVGNLAALWSVARPGGSIIAMRRSHQSVHAAATLAGLSVQYLAPVVDRGLDGLFGLDIDELADALARTSEVVAVHVTSPDYYGYGLDLPRIAETCHAAGVPLIVDEAHGSHLTFIVGSVSALGSGADLVVHSPHKSLGSLTQSALLHLQGDRVDAGRVGEALAMLQSSSPSALLTMSLDAVIEDLAEQGHALWTAQAALADSFRSARVGDERLFRGRIDLPAGVAWADPCKLVVSRPQWSGVLPEVRAQLEHSFGVRPEFTDHRSLVFSVTRNTTRADLERLCLALREIDVPPAPQSAEQWIVSMWPSGAAEPVHDPRTAAQSARAAVALDAAAGYVAARAITPYPPGIPLVLPGERISAETVDTIQRLILAGVTVRGLQATPTATEVVVVAGPVPAPVPVQRDAPSPEPIKRMQR